MIWKLFMKKGKEQLLIDLEKITDEILDRENMDNGNNSGYYKEKYRILDELKKIEDDKYYSNYKIS